MEANELRIGNLILVNGEVQEVCELPLPDNCTQENTEGISLTEEWLLKFGFEKKNKSFNKQTTYNAWNTVIEKHKNRYEYKSASMKYVHQLQNLYFALTGEELEIKEN